MACNWLMMTSSGDNNGRVGVWICSPTKLKIPKAEQETAQPTAARFKNLKFFGVPENTKCTIEEGSEQRVVFENTREVNCKFLHGREN